MERLTTKNYFSKLLCEHVREFNKNGLHLGNTYWNRLRNWGTCHGQEQTVLLNLGGYIQTHCTML